jgi:tetratricopeptide (TPR) repeat protein
MADPDDLFVLMEQAKGLPLTQRVPLSEQAVRLADELGYEDLSTRARLLLVEAYEYSSSGPKMFTPFNWVMQRYEDKPSWFDPDMRHTFLWQLKWMTGDLLDYPEVPLAVVEENLRSMYRIYAEAGEGLGPVHQSAFQLARHVRGVRGADREFETWVASERTTLSDCIACEPSARARYRSQQGRWSDALDLALPALASGKICAEEPSTLYAVVMEPLLETGRAEEAMTAHRRGWRLAAEEETQIDQAATHILVLARSRAIDRGIDVLGPRIHLLDSAATPSDRMILAAAATRLLDAAATEHGMGSRTLPYQGRDVAFEELRHRLRDYTVGLMKRFDARNGTPELGRRVWEKWLQAPYLPALPIAAPVAPPAPPTAAERHPLAPSLADLPNLSVERLDDIVELALRYSPVDDVRTIAAEWARRRDQLPSLREGADVTRLNALGALEYLGAWSNPTITAAHARPYIESASALYREAGSDAEALLVEQWLTARDGRYDDAYAMIPSIDSTGSYGQRGRARIRIVQGIVDEHRTELLAEVREFPCAVDSDHQLRRIWATAHSMGTDSPEELYTWTGEGLAMLLPGEYADTAAGLHVQRAIACKLLMRPEEMATELAESERAGRASGDGPHAAVLLAEARLALSDENAERAEPLLEQAAALADRAYALETFVDAKGMLSDVYRVTGRLLEAAEAAESGLAQVELARVSDVYLEPSIDVKQARITELSAHISADLEETSRASSLYKRAAELYEAAGEPALSGSAWGAYARLVQAGDTLGAVRAFRRGIDLIERVDDQRGLMVLRRALPAAVQDSDGLDAGLRELDLAVALNDTNEARMYTDSDFRALLDEWDFEFERLDLRDTRARMYGTADRFEEALAVLGDIPERMYEHGAEPQGLNSRLLRARLLFATERVDDGIAQLEHIIGVLRTWGDRQPTITEMAGIGVRALMTAGRDADADAFWEKHTT